MQKVKKKNKKSLGFRIFAILLSIVLVGLMGFAIYQIISLNVLPSKLLIPVICVLALLTLILLLLLNFGSSHLWSKILSSLLAVVVIVTMGFGNLYLYTTASALRKVTDNSGKIKNTVSVITMADSAIDELDDLSNKTVGVLNNIDKTGTKKSLKDIKKNEVTVSKTKYDNVPAQVEALYEGQVDAIILNEAYRSNVEDLENYSAFSDETKIIHQTVFYTEDSNDALAVSDITTKPFSVLISGNDSYGSLDEVSRSDVNMVVTVNPVTSTVLMTSIPRDYYVQEVCDDYACNYGAVDKLTHTGIYGVDTTRDTIENLLGIDINYTYRVNFSSMIDIVDALGGVDVEVAEGMAVSHFYSDSSLEGVTEGWNHLDGQRALAYARERKAYLDGDAQRARNQQQVLEAMITKATSSAVLTNYSSILEAISGAFETNMTMEEITSFIQYEIQAMPEWKFETYVLQGYGDTQVSAELGTEVSVIVPYDSSVNIATQKIQAVLDGESSETIESDEADPSGTLSEEEIEAQIAAGKATEGGEYYYSEDTTTYDDSATYDDSSAYDQSYDSEAYQDDSYYYDEQYYE